MYQCHLVDQCSISIRKTFIDQCDISRRRPSSTNVASFEFQASRPSRDSLIDGYCEVFSIIEGMKLATRQAGVDIWQLASLVDRFVRALSSTGGNRTRNTAWELANAATNETWETPRVTPRLREHRALLMTELAKTRKWNSLPQWLFNKRHKFAQDISIVCLDSKLIEVLWPPVWKLLLVLYPDYRFTKPCAIASAAYAISNKEPLGVVTACCYILSSFCLSGNFSRWSTILYDTSYLCLSNMRYQENKKRHL